MNIGKNVSLSNCTFIGKNLATITIPDNYTASGKTFVEDEWSNFEHTIELGDVISANTLFLPYTENTFSRHFTELQILLASGLLLILYNL